MPGEASSGVSGAAAFGQSAYGQSSTPAGGTAAFGQSGYGQAGTPAGGQQSAAFGQQSPYARPGQTGQFGAGGGTGQFAQPGSAGQAGGHSGGFPRPGQTGQFPPMGDVGQSYGSGPRGPESRKPRTGALVAGVAVLALLVGGGAGAAGGYLVADQRASSSSGTALDAPKSTQQVNTPSPAGSVEAVAEKVLPSVVQLQVRGRSSAGEGSGFVISADGLIVTNNHVIEAAAQSGQITAVFQDGRQAPASIVGRDPTSDVAVVKAEITGLVVSELGSSDDLKVGQGVVAIGSPFELSGTVTSGIISSLQRPTRAGGADGSQATVLDAIQTDAAINPGNSGGPLVDNQGRVIGINSAIYSPGASSGDAGSVGIGFAIPIDQARRTADEIVRTGKATQTVLGVSVRDNTDGIGALITEVVPGGAGEQAGLRANDVVTRLGDRRIDNADALVAAVRSKAPGETVDLVLGDNQRTVQATLGGQPVEPN